MNTSSRDGYSETSLNFTSSYTARNCREVTSCGRPLIHFFFFFSSSSSFFYLLFLFFSSSSFFFLFFFSSSSSSSPSSSSSSSPPPSALALPAVLLSRSLHLHVLFSAIQPSLPPFLPPYLLALTRSPRLLRFLTHLTQFPQVSWFSSLCSRSLRSSGR